MTVRRVGHKGADHIAPGNTPASFDAALACGVDMIEFDILPEDPKAPATSRLVLAHDYGTAVRGAHSLEDGLAHLASSPFDGVELDVDLKLPGYEERVERSAATGSSSARSSRRSTCAAWWSCGASSPRSAWAGPSRASRRTTRPRRCCASPPTPACSTYAAASPTSPPATSGPVAATR
jgi:hypothetical protein